jgi:hypothetical protein
LRIEEEKGVLSSTVDQHVQALVGRQAQCVNWGRFVPTVLVHDQQPFRTEWATFRVAFSAPTGS